MNGNYSFKLLNMMCFTTSWLCRGFYATSCREIFWPPICCSGIYSCNHSSWTGWHIRLFQTSRLWPVLQVSRNLLLRWIQSGAAGYEKGVVECFQSVIQAIGPWAVLCCTSKKGERCKYLSQAWETFRKHFKSLFHNLPSQTACNRFRKVIRHLY